MVAANIEGATCSGPSGSRSWHLRMRCNDWRIAHEEEQLYVEASTVVDGRSEEGRQSRTRRRESTDQRGGRRGVLCGTGRQGRHQESASCAQVFGQGKRAG